MDSKQIPPKIVRRLLYTAPENVLPVKGFFLCSVRFLLLVRYYCGVAMVACLFESTYTPRKHFGLQQFWNSRSVHYTRLMLVKANCWALAQNTLIFQKNRKQYSFIINVCCYFSVLRTVFRSHFVGFEHKYADNTIVLRPGTCNFSLLYNYTMQMSAKLTAPNLTSDSITKVCICQFCTK